MFETEMFFSIIFCSQFVFYKPQIVFFSILAEVGFLTNKLKTSKIKDQSDSDSSTKQKQSFYLFIYFF